MTVVTPVCKGHQSNIAQHLGQFQGHILNLVPGDYQYDPPQFTITIGWNLRDHFFPTEMCTGNDVYHWKLALCHKFLGGAVEMFNEAESELLEEEDTVLVDAMQTLRNQMEVTQQLLASRSRGIDQTVPPITVHSKHKTAMTHEMEVDYLPIPLIRHVVKEKNPDVASTMLSAKSTSNPAAPKLFPPIEQGPALLQDDFQIPAHIQKSSKRPAEVDPDDDDGGEASTSKRVTRSSKSSGAIPKGKGKGKGKSGSVSLPKPPSVTPSWLPPKRFTCSQCGHSTDRKNDFENHMNQHTGHKLPCDTCGKVFYSEASRQTHMKNTHLNIKRAKCSIPGCLWEDKDFGKLKVHQFDAHGIGEEAKCSQCERKFDNWRSYQRHQTTCGRQKDKKCPLCPRIYKDLDKLTKHMKETHAGKGYSPCICDKCGKVMKNKDSLRSHKANSCK